MEQQTVATVRSEMAIMGIAGDTKVMWDSANEDEVENARRTFKDLRKKGYLAYKVTKNGDKAEMLTEFDPKAERIILSPPLAGG